MNAKYKIIIIVLPACFSMTKNQIFENFKIGIARVSYMCECKSFIVMFIVLSVMINSMELRYEVFST